MPDAKFESGNFYSFGDMMSQSFPLQMRSSHKSIYPRKIDLTLKKFPCPDSLFRPKIDSIPPCQFQQFSSRGFFFIFKVFGTSQ